MASSSIARARAFSRLIPRSCSRSASAICCPTVITGFRLVIGSWKIIPIWLPRSFRSSLAGIFSRSRPSKRISPPTIRPGGLWISPRIDIAVTLLPDPDSPTTPNVSPGWRSQLTSFTARTTPPGVTNSVVSPWMERTGLLTNSASSNDPLLKTRTDRRAMGHSCATAVSHDCGPPKSQLTVTDRALLPEGGERRLLRHRVAPHVHRDGSGGAALDVEQVTHPLDRAQHDQPVDDVDLGDVVHQVLLEAVHLLQRGEPGDHQQAGRAGQRGGQPHLTQAAQPGCGVVQPDRRRVGGQHDD